MLLDAARSHCRRSAGPPTVRAHTHLLLYDKVSEEASPTPDGAVEVHARLRASAPFRQQLAVLNAQTHGFVAMLRAAWLTSNRDPASANYLFWHFVDDLLASAVGIELLVREGIDGPARRELRFMLELVIRHLYVDVCTSARETPLGTRLAYVEHKLGKRDVELLDELALALVEEKDEFRRATRALYGELSRETHPMHEQLARRLERAERGAYIGFETASDLQAFNELLRRAYDILLVFVAEALGPSSAGDLMLVLDDAQDWPFRSTRFMVGVSGMFDYKRERNASGEGPGVG